MSLPDGETPIQQNIPDYIRGDDRAVLKQGAEARIYTTTLNNKSTQNIQQYCVAKERFSKKYRIAELDTKLRKRQLKNETKALELCAKNAIPAPTLIDVDNENCVIYTNKIDGITVRDYINNLGDLTAKANAEKIKQLGLKMGQIIAKLHSLSLIHGDLTTSNFMTNINNSSESTNITNSQDQQEDDMIIYSIDFGLSQISDNVEDKAVDLYVLERAIDTTHNQSQQLIEIILNEYRRYLDDLCDNIANQSQQSQQETTTTATTATTSVDEQLPNVPVSDNVDPQQQDTDTIQSSAQNDTVASNNNNNGKKKDKENKKLKNKQRTNGTAVMARLKEVRARGRKKSMIG